MPRAAGSLEVEDPGLAEDRVGARAEALAVGLAGIGVGNESEVVVSCCAEHFLDACVAERSAHILGAEVVDSDLESSANPPRPLTRRFVLACPDRAVSWHKGTHSRGLLITDGPGDGLGQQWWRLLELRGAQALRNRAAVPSLAGL
jgi:hypothetical protein